MEEIFEFNESHLNNDNPGVELSFMNFLDRASKILMQSTKYVHKDSPWNIPTGVAFRLEFPSESGYIKIPKPDKNGWNKFNPIKTVAREFSQYFSLEIDDVESYTSELRDVYNAEHEDSGYKAGGLGYESVAGSSQDFARFVNILLERDLISKEKLQGVKIYAKPNGRHKLAKKGVSSSNSEVSTKKKYNFKILRIPENKDGIIQNIADSIEKRIFVKTKDFGGIEQAGKEQVHAILRKIVNSNEFDLASEKKSDILRDTKIRESSEASGTGSGVPGARKQLNYLINFIEYISENLDFEIDLEESYLELEMKAENESLEPEGDKFTLDAFGALEKNTNVILEGVAGSGKSHLLGSLRKAFYKQEESKITYWVALEENKKDTEKEKKDKLQQIVDKKSEGFSPLYGENGERIEVVVFHPSTSYEEFVSGIRPNFMKNKKNKDDFVTQEGVFIEQCNRAASNPDKKFLLFIDEINRANTSRVFGDLEAYSKVGTHPTPTN